MYLTHVASKVADAFIKALKRRDHPVLARAFPNLWVGVDFPAVEANYPGVWVSFEPSPTLTRAGIAHVEYVHQENGTTRRGTRWMFSGSISATVVAMTRRERDELLDELLRMFAFADEDPATSDLRQALEGDKFISMNVLFEQVQISGMGNGSAPWDPEVMVWEGTLTANAEGEFVSDLASRNVLVPIEAIVISPEVEQPVPQGPDQGWM